VRLRACAACGAYDGAPVIVRKGAAVVHYDLAWNPTRRERREGRVDRFGQLARTAGAVMVYGADNGRGPSYLLPGYLIVIDAVC
jgi:hypothetical protein